MNSGFVKVITFNGLNGVVSVGTDEIPEGRQRLFYPRKEDIGCTNAPGARSIVARGDVQNVHERKKE